MGNLPIEIGIYWKLKSWVFSVLDVAKAPLGVIFFQPSHGCELRGVQPTEKP